MRFLFLLVCCLLSISAYSADIATQQLLLRGVDKITGRVSTIQATVNQPVHFGALTIVPQRCLTKPPEETPENAVFLTIYEDTPEDPNQEVFKGWMFSSNPALSAMEHPIYDIWILKCINKDIVKNLVSPHHISKEEDLHLVADDDNPALAED